MPRRGRNEPVGTGGGGSRHCVADPADGLCRPHLTEQGTGIEKEMGAAPLSEFDVRQIGKLRLREAVWLRGPTARQLLPPGPWL